MENNSNDSSVKNQNKTNNNLIDNLIDYEIGEIY